MDATRSSTPFVQPLHGRTLKARIESMNGGPGTPFEYEDLEATVRRFAARATR